MTNKENKLQAVLDKTVDGRKVFGTSFAIKKDASIWTGNSGNMTDDQAYFIASTTKLFTTAIILHLQSKDLIQLDNKINQFLDSSVLDELHVFEGKDYAQNLTIKHLLSHTSGLPDYFQGKNKDGISLEDELKSGNDQSWTFEEALEKSKILKPLFVPGTKNKAYYSDTNFQLLGKIIEVVTGKSYNENCEQLIIKPL